MILFHTCVLYFFVNSFSTPKKVVQNVPIHGQTVIWSNICCKSWSLCSDFSEWYTSTAIRFNSEVTFTIFSARIVDFWMQRICNRIVNLWLMYFYDIISKWSWQNRIIITSSTCHTGVVVIRLARVGPQMYEIVRSWSIYFWCVSVVFSHTC